MQIVGHEVVLFPQERLIAIEEHRRVNHLAMGDPWHSILSPYGSQGIWVSVLDFADQLIQILDILDKRPEDGVVADRFWQNEGGRKIEFVRRGEVVTIASDLFPDLTLVVLVGVFMAEARRFLLDFIGAIGERLPELLEWESLERLGTYYQEEDNRPNP